MKISTIFLNYLFLHIQIKQLLNLAVKFQTHGFLFLGDMDDCIRPCSNFTCITARTVSVSNNFSISPLHVYKCSLQKLRNLKCSKLQTFCTHPQMVIELSNLCTSGSEREKLWPLECFISQVVIKQFPNVETQSINFSTTKTIQIHLLIVA